MKDYRGYILLAVALAVFPLLVQSHYYLSMLVVIGLYTLVTAGLSLLMGYAGQVSLGHAAFYGLGAYGSAILTTRFGLNPWAAMAAAAVITALVAFVLGVPTLKLREHYLALGTLGLGVMVFIFFNETIWLTGGPSGLMETIPYPSIGGLVINRDREFFYLVWALTLPSLVLARNLIHSRVGRALRAIHGSEVAAESMGIDTARYKVYVFVLSAIYGSIAGSLYAHYLAFVNPSPFSFMASIQFLVMAVVGGLTHEWGPLVGVTIIVILGELLRDWVPLLLPNAGGEYQIVVFGLILILVMIFMPEGVAREAELLYERLRLSRGKGSHHRLDASL